MSRAVLATIAVLGGCTQMQSARTLPAGKSRISVGVTRMSSSLTNVDVPFYLGEVHVAYGVTDTAEVGVQLGRSAGIGDAISSAGIAPKLSLHETRAYAISVAIPAVIAWDESRALSTFAVAAAYPTLYLGFRLDDETELVWSPRIGGLWRPRSGDAGNLLGFGATVGLAIGARARATVQPEIGITFLQSTLTDKSEAVFTVGFGVTAGNGAAAGR